MRIGIDLGSRAIKLVFYNGKDFIEMKKYETVEFYKRFGKKGKKGIKIDLVDLHTFLENVPIEILKNCDKLVITGYGKNNLNIEDAEIISEINAHARGARFQTESVNFTLTDLGGQDSKVIFVKEGNVVDFIMNDKCAAGGGRYLDNMARILGVTLDKLGEYYKNPVQINSTCATFGESEMLGKLMEGYKLEELCAGINEAVFNRIFPILNRFKSDIFILCGGVAKNNAIKRLIELKTGREVIVPRYPQFNGAIGCVVDS